MKQAMIALCAFGFGLMAMAQSSAPGTSPAQGISNSPPGIGATAPASAADSTTSPADMPYQNNPKALAECSARVDAIGKKPCDIIFIGDSITARWLSAGKSIWDKIYAPRHALNFGVEGDTTQNVLWRLNNMSIQNLRPKVAVVLIGANNAENTAHDIANGIRAVLSNTQEAFPGVKIILVGLMPNPFSLEKFMQVNSLIKGYADNEQVYFLNLIPLMPDVTNIGTDGKPESRSKGIGPDHIHPDATGYQIWATAMEPLLTKLLAGK
jgi:lysophospholipase L1-like esterase